MEHPQNPIIDSHDLVKIVIKDRMHIVIHTDVHTIRTYLCMITLHMINRCHARVSDIHITYHMYHMIWYVHYSYVDFTYAQWGHTTYL